MKKVFLILFTLAIPFIFLSAQSKQSERLFKAGNFSEAIPFLENDLKEKSNLTVKSKLAYCYRMTNQNAKALALYSEIVKKERARPEISLYYGEALMMNAQYDSAKIYFQRYQQLEPKDEKANLMINSLEQLKDIAPSFPSAKIIPYLHNSDADDSAPVIFQNGLVFSSDRQTGFKPLKEKSGATGRDYLNLYFSEFERDTLFDLPEWFSSKINELNRNTGSITFTSNGKKAFYAQNSAVAGKSGNYNLQLFTAENHNNSWQNIELLPFNTPETNLMHPAVSSDGTELFFSSSKGDSHGGTDIYRAKKNKNGSWSQIENLGAVINTSASEGFPFVDREGRLYFCSKGHPGYGGFDIFVAERDEYGRWKKPKNLGKPINSPSDDISFYLFYEGLSGVFTSNREGGDDDIYFFQQQDSTDILKKEIAFHMPTITKEVQQKDTISLKNIEEKQTEIKEEKEPKIEEKTTPKTKNIIVKSVKNLDSLKLLFDKTNIDSTYKINEKSVFSLEKIHFNEKNELDSLSKNELDELKFLLEKNPLYNVQFLIHTSLSGKEKDNLERSKKQGLRLTKYLSEKGIARERLRSKGMGKAQPLCEKNCEETFGFPEEQINARVEIKVSRK
jgi:peptidoglycan-associated lipoprotein